MAHNLPQQGIGFLFGCERFGMRNEDVYRCHAALSIPSNPDFASLNLGAAVQLIAYEWRLALGGFAVPEVLDAPVAALADAQQVAGMLGHLEHHLRIGRGRIDGVLHEIEEHLKQIRARQGDDRTRELHLGP